MTFYLLFCTPGPFLKGSFVEKQELSEDNAARRNYDSYILHASAVMSTFKNLNTPVNDKV